MENIKKKLSGKFSLTDIKGIAELENKIISSVPKEAHFVEIVKRVHPKENIVEIYSILHFTLPKSQQ